MARAPIPPPHKGCPVPAAAHGAPGTAACSGQGLNPWLRAQAANNSSVGGKGREHGALPRRRETDESNATVRGHGDTGRQKQREDRRRAQWPAAQLRPAPPGGRLLGDTCPGPGSAPGLLLFQWGHLQCHRSHSSLWATLGSLPPWPGSWLLSPPPRTETALRNAPNRGSWTESPGRLWARGLTGRGLCPSVPANQRSGRRHDKQDPGDTDSRGHRCTEKRKASPRCPAPPTNGACPGTEGS